MAQINQTSLNRERKRLDISQRHDAPWRLWGPYLSERQWGTVREDYSQHGSAWDSFTHDMARSRAYRWGEDGIAGISDNQQRLCFAVAMWNGRDPILKERLFGLAGPEGNHGEDVKEAYFYIDATPTHSYLKMLYKYPQAEFPYAHLVAENARRGKGDLEFELVDTGVFDSGRYFDVFVEYAKAGPDDILIQIEVHNRGDEPASLRLLPQLWFRNTWSWDENGNRHRPTIEAVDTRSVRATHNEFGEYFLHSRSKATWLFSDNETNTQRLFGVANAARYTKDAFHEYVVNDRADAVNPQQTGTKCGALIQLQIPPGGVERVCLRLNRTSKHPDWRRFDAIVQNRKDEADEFFETVHGDVTDADMRLVQRQAYAGMIWSRQFFSIDMPRWQTGDPSQPAPPPGRARNSEWTHLNNADVLTMPDKWEYPYYCVWDSALQCAGLARIDPDWAKHELTLLLREWYMHPNGQIPAYEWAFGDVNPPVHAWAAWRVYEIDRTARGCDAGGGDLDFLERIFHKLLLNFTWWVNRKDREGRNIFQGGFLGLDNIGVFDRSAPLPTGGYINQADGTSWMAMYCLNMLRIALELAQRNHNYEDAATKFFEHFLYVAAAMNDIGGEGINLWDEEDAFYYDVLGLPDGRRVPLKVRSLVGLIPLLAVEVLDNDMLARVPAFKARLEWFLNYRPDLAGLVSRWFEPPHCASCRPRETRLLSLLRGHRMKCLLKRMLDESEFLSPYGIRAVSRHHLDHPYVLDINGERFSVAYQPGESDSGLFGGNSNWRGPVWMPVNFLIIESLRQFDRYYGENFKVECPTGSGNMLSIREVADELTRRLARLFLRDENGRRAVFGDNTLFQTDSHFRDYPLFHEYFHGDSGRGVGASHQTGWTALIASLVAESKLQDPASKIVTAKRLVSEPVIA